MELVAPRNIILRALSAAAAIAPEKAPRPILSHALMVADAKGHVTITAQQEAPLTYTTSISAMVKRPGKVCFPARYLGVGVDQRLRQGRARLQGHRRHGGR
jgi:DNA polymerase III sliding clamp (beta) subunit (PCNA family)